LLIHFFPFSSAFFRFPSSSLSQTRTDLPPLTAFPAAKLYLPAGAVSKAQQKGYLPASESQYFVYGKESTTGEVGSSGGADPLKAATGGEMESADFGKAFANEVSRGPSTSFLLILPD
jgi:hypothetical protein